MTTKGIRISDEKKNILNVTLSDILEEIHDGSSYFWVLLFLDGILNPGQTMTIYDYEEKINKSENGFTIEWQEIIKLSDKFFQMFDLTLLGCKNPKLLHRYENDQEMYKTCDIVIELIDTCYWEVFSTNENLIDRLATKFKKIKFLESDFEK